MTWEEVEKASMQNLFAKPGEEVYNFNYTCIYNWETKKWDPLPINEQERIRNEIRAKHIEECRKYYDGFIRKLDEAFEESTKAYGSIPIIHGININEL